MTQPKYLSTLKLIVDYNTNQVAIVSNEFRPLSGVEEFTLLPLQYQSSLFQEYHKLLENKIYASNTSRGAAQVDNTATNTKIVSEQFTSQPESLKLVNHIANVAETLLKQKKISDYEYHDLVTSIVNVRYFTRRESLQEVVSEATKFAHIVSKTTSPPTIELVQKPPSPVFSTESSGKSGSEREEVSVDRSSLSWRNLSRCRSK